MYIAKTRSAQPLVLDYSIGSGGNMTTAHAGSFETRCHLRALSPEHVYFSSIYWLGMLENIDRGRWLRRLLHERLEGERLKDAKDPETMAV